MTKNYYFKLHDQNKTNSEMIEKTLSPPGFFRTKYFRYAIFLLVWVAGTFYCEIVRAQQHENAILTDDDRLYLQQLGEVKMCVDPDWEPYEYINENGVHEGIAADLIKLITERVGISLTLVPTKNWDESLEASKAGKCEILSLLNQTAERDKWLLFTEAFVIDPNVFITREEHAFISDPAGLSGETIVLPRGTSIEEFVRKDYPNLEIILVESEAEAIAMVSGRKADMTMRSLTVAAYIIKKEGLFNLKIAGQLPGYVNKFRIGVIKSQPMLRDILDKAIRTITPHEVQQIVNRYISIKAVTAFDYALLIKIVLIFVFLAAIVLFWNYKLRKVNIKLAAREAELLVIGNKLEEDIESRILAEEALRESEEKYRLLTENTADVIWVLNLNTGKFTYISPSVFQLRGVTASEAMNESIEDSLTPDSVLIVKDAIENNVKKFIANPQVPEHYINELQQYCKNGQFIWIEVSTQFRFSPSGAIEILGVTRNIEERKITEAEIIQKNEELKKLINEKDKFFSIIAHDLKSPFNSILGFSEMLKDEARDLDIDSIVQYAGIINSSAQHTFELLENLLDWARMQQGRIPFEPQKFLLNSIVSSEIDGLKNNADQKNIQLINGSQENLIVTADENMISTVVRNLISNAIKFTPKGGEVKVEAKVEVKAEAEVEVENGQVIISVSDTGIGMTSETIEKLFKIETSFTTRGTENEKGTGLGLLLCKEFIEKHEGKIWVESNEGKGSTFSFSLPAK